MTRTWTLTRIFRKTVTRTWTWTRDDTSVPRPLISRMNKWLKDRQLGKTVKKETILENISKCPKFEYKGTIEFASRNLNQLAQALQWINDDRNLVALMYDPDTYRTMITIWKDQNIYARQRLESKIDLEQFTDKRLSSMICNDSSALLYGWEPETPNDPFGDEEGFISNISIETGQLESFLRNRL